MTRMDLYHFTSPERLALILADGMIRTTENNLRPPGDGVGPAVVWLTDEPEPEPAAVGLDGMADGTDKTAVRLTVRVAESEVIWWPDFANEYAMPRAWRRALERERDPESWWVLPRTIGMTEVVAIERAVDD